MAEMARTRLLDVTLETVTPLFLAGADPTGEPELRPASFRGVLRFWLRALVGARVDGVPGLREVESAVFGSTDLGSPVMVRTSAGAEPPLQIGERRFLPHKRWTSPAFAENGRFLLTLSPRTGLVRLPFQPIAALMLFLNLGGLGRRSRRGFGSLRAVDVETDGIDLPEGTLDLLAPKLIDGAGLADHISRVIGWTDETVGSTSRQKSTSTIPVYPVLASNHAKVLVCQHAFSTYQQAMADFWAVLRSDRYRKHKRAFGYIGRRRRASPLILHIGRSGRGYHLVMTAFRSEPSPLGAQGWSYVASFMAECADTWDGRFVFGGAGPW